MNDGRAGNRLSEEAKEIDARLEAWGLWARDGQPRAFPAETLLKRMMKYGALGAAQTGGPPISMPDEIAAVDAAVARLAANERKVLKAYYMRDEPIEVVAKRCRMKLRTLQATLQRARRMVDSML